MDFGNAAATAGFDQTTAISNADGKTLIHGVFKAAALAPLNRFGMPTSAVYGQTAGHLQHGQSLFWLAALVQDERFLRLHPEFAGTVTEEPLAGTQIYEDLKFLNNGAGLGLYKYLYDLAREFGETGPEGPVAPTPNRPDSGNLNPNLPVNPAPAPAAPAATQTGGDPGLSAADLVELRAILARAYPSRAAQLEELTVLVGGNSTPAQLIQGVLPIIIKDPKALGVIEALALAFG